MATESACLLIAGISGYTSYLAGVELDRAQDILADLMRTSASAWTAMAPLTETPDARLPYHPARVRAGQHLPPMMCSGQ